MSDRAILRPGSRLGVYPQQLESQQHPFERIGGQWLKLFRDKLSWQRYRLNYIADQVEQASVGLPEMSDDALAKHRDAVRYQLLRNGLTSEPIIQAFALIREYSTRVLGMRHYDVQLLGGWVMINGNMAEMATGEGKTLTATLAAATAALAGIPTHVITTNEYLVKRDAEEMQTLYKALGLSVAAVVETMNSEQKKTAYQADIVYCTNKQITFDYLRDRLMSQNESGTLTLKFSDANKAEQLLLRGLCFAIVDEADSVLVDEARTPLILSKEHRDEDQEKIYAQALIFARQMQENRDFTIFHREQQLTLTEQGKTWLTEQTQTLSGIWSGRRHSEYLVHQALTSLHMYHKDEHYLIRNNKIEIIDRNTGRTMADRSWQKGLHQMIESKEGCAMTGQRETIARISYQRFFRRYLHLSGMSGTLKQVKGELRSVYGLHTVAIPTHRPNLRQRRGYRIYGRSEDHINAIIEKITSTYRAGQPVLIGTCSVAESEQLSDILHKHNVAHTVLNARQDAQEADIIAKAGQREQITIATNMAGRGTDIKLGEKVKKLGGLHVIVTACNEEYRVDRQLIGRCARQGDPGSYETLLCLHDTVIQRFYSPWVRRQLGHLTLASQPLPQWLSAVTIKLAQTLLARRYSLLRRDLLQQDEKLSNLLTYSGRQE